MPGTTLGRSTTFSPEQARGEMVTSHPMSTRPVWCYSSDHRPTAWTGDSPAPWPLPDLRRSARASSIAPGFPHVLDAPSSARSRASRPIARRRRHGRRSWVDTSWITGGAA